MSWEFPAPRGRWVVRPTVVVFDYGFGNVRSAQNSLMRAGAQVEITRDPEAATLCDGLVVPGVGAFAACMAGLRAADGPRIVTERLAAQRPVLGICVGMQVMFDAGDEHGVHTPGLGFWHADVSRLDAAVLPHMGWNTVEVPAGSELMRGVADQRFYFVHSYAARSWPGNADEVTWSTHGERFVAAAETGPLRATQFHPEKSGEAGIVVMGNWLATLR